jgi:hypothetical protein
MNRNLLSEELNRIKYLFDHERGVVISENKGNSSNWKGKIDLSGPIEYYGTYGVVAEGINYKGGKYHMTLLTKLPETFTEQSDSDTIDNPTLEGFSLINDAFPYPDNMIGPKFENFAEAKQLYDTFITKLKRFIEKGGLNNITKIKIQGTADAAAPNTSIPRGYNSLDHNLVGDSVPYGGLTDKKDMNQYLADNRAKVLGQMIINEISERTGVDISSKMEYSSINYYGESNKRGQQFRAVKVEPIYTSFEVSSGGGDTAQGSSTTNASKVYVDLSEYGFPDKIAEKKDGGIAIKQSDLEGVELSTWSNQTLNNKRKVIGEISNDELKVDGLSFGKLVSSTDENFDRYIDKGNNNTKYVTVGRPVIVGKKGDYIFIKILRFTLELSK